MAPSSSSSSPPPPPPKGGATPSQPPLASAQKKGFLRRILPFLLATNLAVGVYVLLRTSQNQGDKKDEESAVVTVPSTSVTKQEAIAAPASVTRIPAPVKALPPIPEDTQRQLFKWILDEKRKVKPNDRSEKKKIDEEKALLKELIKAKTIPSL